MSTDLSRRSFLSAAIGAFAASHSAALLPARPVSRTWIFFDGGPRWTQSAWEPGWFAVLIALRSDGQYFYARGICPEREHSPGRRELENWKLRVSLDRFLNCDCVAGQPCARHTPREIVESEEE